MESVMIQKLKKLLENLTTLEKTSSSLTHTTSSGETLSHGLEEDQDPQLTPSGSISEGIKAQLLPTSHFHAGFPIIPREQSLKSHHHLIRHISDLLSNQDYEKALEMIKEKSAEINSSLILAVQTNDASLCRQLLDKRELGELAARCCARDFEGNSPLHIASEKGYLKVCETLLDYGESIEINARNLSGRSPLHLACLKGFQDIVQMLVRSGADLLLKDREGNNSAHFSVVSGNVRLVEWISARGVDFNCKNCRGRTPFDICENLDVREFLEKRNQVSSPVFSLAKSFDFLGMMQKLNGLIRKSCNSEEFENGIKLNPSHFRPVQMLGKGSFGEVYLVEKKDTKKLFAMKILMKNKILGQNLIRYAVTERNVASCVKHPFIVPLRYSFQTSNKLYLILDYCPGGSLSQHLKKEKRFNEDRARLYLSEILLALEELHKRDIIYRDLKPDNVVLDAQGHALLTDFGLSKEGVQEKDSARSFCGSVAYLAPEMLQRTGHGKAVDWYLLGTLLYEMIIGIPPFYSQNRNELFFNIKKGKLRVPASLSSECKNLLKELLQKDPSKRLGSENDAADVKKHEFFEGVDWMFVYNKGLSPPVPPLPVISKGYLSDEVIGDVLDDSQQVLPGWTFVSN
jgi:protein-serine/threonine kinase